MQGIRNCSENCDPTAPNGNVLKWIVTFLRNHTQIVKVNGEELFSAPVLLSGIPQGSVHGPFLLAIYNNDLPDRISFDSFLFFRRYQNLAYNFS